jgi:hypothetical protein
MPVTCSSAIVTDVCSAVELLELGVEGEIEKGITDEARLEGSGA